MHWNSFSDFLAMGGYATYVWGSFGVTVLLMTLEPILLARGQNQLVARLKRQFRAELSERSEPSKYRSKE
jgi:heme exporter protein D